MQARVLWPAFHRLVARALLERIARHFAVGVTVHEIAIEVRRTRDQPTTNLIYRLQAPPGTQGRLGFQIPQGMAPVRRVECDVSPDSDPWNGKGRISRDVLLLETDRDRSWSGANVRFCLDWPPTKEGDPDALGRILLIPDVGPRLLQSARASVSDRQPSIRLSAVDKDEACFAAVAVPNDGTSARGLDLLQAALVPSQSESAARGSEPVSLSVAFRAQLRPHQANAVKEHIVNMLEFLGRAFGVVPPVRVGVVLPSELRARPFPMGACVFAKPEEFGYGTNAVGKRDINLSARMGSIWWGAGCRVLGARGYDISSGIALGVGLHWASVLGDTEKVRMVRERYARVAETASLRNSWKVFTQDTSNKLVTALGLAVHDAIATDDQFLPTLRTLTRATWGRFVQPASVISTLQLRGKHGEIVRRMIQA